MRRGRLIVAICFSASVVYAEGAFAQHVYSSVLNIRPNGIANAAPGVQSVFFSDVSGFSATMGLSADYQTGPIPTAAGSVLASHGGTLTTQADIPAGAFHTFNSADALPFEAGYIFANSATVYRDQLSFLAGSSGAQIHMFLTSDGTLGKDVDPRQASDVSGYEAQIQLATVVGHSSSGIPIFATGQAGIENTCGRNGCVSQEANGFGRPDIWSANLTRGALSGDADVIDVTLNLAPGSSNFDLHVVTQSFVRGSTVNFADTTRISILAPADVSYRSESGLLLTSVSSVPEPETLWLALFGLVPTIFFRRKFKG